MPFLFQIKLCRAVSQSGAPLLNKVVFAKNAKRNFFCATATLRSGNVSDVVLQGICVKCSFSCKYSYAVRFLQSFLRK